MQSGSLCRGFPVCLNVIIDEQVHVISNKVESRPKKVRPLKDLDFFENDRIVLLCFVCTTGFDDLFLSEREARGPCNGNRLLIKPVTIIRDGKVK